MFRQTFVTLMQSWYPQDKINEYPLAVGEELVLVAGLQARNNARVVIAGSYLMFSDKFQASVQKWPVFQAENQN